MAVVQIIAVTTSDIGPMGPTKKIYAVGHETAEAALEGIQQHLKSREVAQWIDTRNLTLSPGHGRLRPFLFLQREASRLGGST
jgi:hypothetical protein